MMALNFLPEIERSPVGEIKKYQETRLQQQLGYLQTRSAFYSDLFKKNGIDISRIKTLGDLTLIPPTTKEDLQQRNAEFICVPRTSIIDYITTSGTLGDPVTFVMTDKDLDRLAYN